MIHGNDDDISSPQEASKQQKYGSAGTILEAAFVDRAFDWPPPDGIGKNAIELQASINLMEDSDSVRTTESQKQRMTIPPKPSLHGKSKKSRWWHCCKSGGDEAILNLAEYENAKRDALAARKEHYAEKKARAKVVRKKSRYRRVPEGILIYRLDTASQTISLMSEPHSKTDESTLLREMVVAAARPSSDKSRRGMILTGVDGSYITLVACEQRTAIAWLEAIDLMLANKIRMGNKVRPIVFDILPMCLRILTLYVFFNSVLKVNQDRMEQKESQQSRVGSD
jgi:hypothetical protein